MSASEVTSSLERMIFSLRTVRVYCLIVAIAGALLLLGSIPGFDVVTWTESYAAPGAGLVASALAALAALSATTSWQEQRRRDAETAERRHREEVYEHLLTHMTAVFVGGGSPTGEAGIRAKVALWASDETVDALSAWNDLTSEIMRSSGGVVGARKPELFSRYSAVLLSARRELSVAESLIPDEARLLRMIFNDYPR